MTPQQVIDKLISDAEYSQNTEKQYRLLFNKFVGYLDVHEIKLTDVTTTVIQAFFDKNDHSRKTQSLYIGLLAQIFDILAESGIELDNPAYAWNQKAKKRRRGKAMQRLPVALTSDEEKRLVETMKSDLSSLPAIRGYTLIYLILGTGLRISEALGLKLNDVYFGDENPHIRVIGKGDKERTVPLSDSVIVVLESYLEARRQHKILGDYLFAHRAGAPFTRYGADKLIGRYLKQAEIVKPKMGCHILRHTFVTRQFQAGIQPATIKAWIGHSDLTVTFKVYEHVASAPAGVRPA